MECLLCKKPIDSIPGRRPKMYCGNNCRQKAWQQKQKGANTAPKAEKLKFPAPKQKKRPKSPEKGVADKIEFTPTQEVYNGEKLSRYTADEVALYKEVVPEKKSPPAGLSKIELLKWHKSH